MRALILLTVMLPRLVAAQALGFSDGFGMVDTLSGGTITSAICWYASTQSVCVDSTSDGVLKFYGSGGSNNEDLSWDYETTANTVAVASSTGVTQITFSGMDLKPDTVTLAAGGQWKAGTSDDMVCLQEVGVADDNMCFLVQGDALYIRQGDGTTDATTAMGAVNSSSWLRSTMAAGGRLIVVDDTDPGDASGTGTVEFQANDDASNAHTMAKIELDVTDASTGAEYADLVFEATTNGTDATEYLRIDSSIGGLTFSNGTTGGTITAGTSDDMVCLVETGATTDNICMKTIGDELWVYDGTGTSLTTVKGKSMVASKNDGTATVEIVDGGAGDANSTANLKFVAKDSGGTDHTYGRVELDVTSATAGAEYGDLVFYAATNGTDDTEYMRFDSSEGELHFEQGYTRHVNFPINSANQGASAPTAVTIGNARCLSFADGEIAHIEWSVPADWDGASDMTFELHTFLDSSDSPTNGEDMCFDISYNAVAVGELYDKTSTTGEMVLDLATATQKAHYEPSYTIDYDDADNPLAAGDEFLLSFTFEADAGGSCGTGGVYGGEVIVCGAHVEYTSNALPEN